MPQHTRKPELLGYQDYLTWMRQGLLAWFNEGEHTFTWDGTGENGERLASGCYFYCIEAEDKAIFSKTVLIR